MTDPVENVLQPGLVVQHRRQRHVIVSILDLETVLLRNLESGGIVRVAVRDLDPQRPFTHLEKRPLDLTMVEEEPWKAATTRYNTIEPLLALPKGARTQARVAERAAAAGVHPATIYRWIDAFEQSGKLSALLPKERRDKGSYKIDTATEAIVQEVIDELYLTRQRRGVRTVVREIERRCRERGLMVPHYNTVRKRVQDRSAYIVTERRLGKKAAEDRYGTDTKPFPGADYPLSVVQMDHVELDLELVDDLEGRPIGKAWLTLMICVRTRMIPGFYLTLDDPNAFSVGMCVANAILPKDDLLAKYGVDAQWPIQGFPRMIHTDNAREFHSAALERACAEYGFSQDYRPRGQPKFGGHVERLAKTFNDMLHEEPGTTFGSPARRGDYDAAKQAVYTLDRLEEWVVKLIKIYHGTYHTGIQTTPLQRYLDDVRGDDTRPGIGIHVPNVDPHRLRLDFMPFFERTVQSHGVQFETVRYYHDVLRPWVGAPDPKHVKRARKLLFRYDPRDMSRVFFYDPELREYFPIPYRDTSFPALSKWEIREAKRHAVARGKAAVDTEALFAAHADLQRTRDTATKETKARRRSAQRKRLVKPVVPDEYFQREAPSVGDPSSSSEAKKSLVYVPGFEEVDFA
ncbi:Mu transposase C-terminal domain-containing protein [Deinococcus budaensis]|uniref:Putative transposase n=1 Tax=Deinococcus budaensis TaxID=1665626 RepID=A0A7W8GHF6_9DEIO|nr:Mu transposase C-terminal domain-containing protein [Deinococcus budaensis]MBB5235394.1 putative transposase [Deinococcus budaensis]